MTDFTQKRAEETEVFTVDFINVLASGETITAASWANTVIKGIDPSPSAMVHGSSTINGSMVCQLLTAGVPGCTYRPLCTVTTSMGQTLVLPDYGQGALSVVP